MAKVLNDLVMQRTSLTRLNQLGADQNFLILLRVLCTSDLTFQYMLYEKNTLRDMLMIAEGIHQMTTNMNESSLTEEENLEYLVLVNQIQEYIDQE